jgi:hypothetical protein
VERTKSPKRRKTATTPVPTACVLVIGLPKIVGDSPRIELDLPRVPKGAYWELQAFSHSRKLLMA